MPNIPSEKVLALKTCPSWKPGLCFLEPAPACMQPQSWVAREHCYHPTAVGPIIYQDCRCDVLLASSPYGCIFPYCEEEGEPLFQQKTAISCILGIWLDQYLRNFPA
ncbi:hypothetical protein QTO34_009444 [Cnephaeus nilssonii]|uniref:Uncharacterized protein n=1 Tax=Cnephaeus nilssonii TaxID=3371016 RepID=A0AA40LGJ9_CNENI|nr:hypothetical protein QTO34_009444 [Eptesicus nilssonii]